ncbi:MAG: iron-sulfur cluster carrier protein ApbC [Pseudomonadota bacterium]
MFFKKKRQSPKQANNDIDDTSIVEHLCRQLGIKSTPLVSVTATASELKVVLPVACKTHYESLETSIKDAKLIPEAMHVAFSQNIPIMHAPKSLIPNIKNIIAVSSGKGGVGKSATSINLAYALKHQGARVGVLDADIYGPSVPIMVGQRGASPESPDNKCMIPIAANGIVTNSIGYLVKNDHASIWRGPMASKALQQLLNETRWPLLDYLIVDMPPGTGDIQLTMAQQMPLTAAVVVTTPQDLATADAEKGIAMYEKLDIPILGLVENMSEFLCPHCHKTTDIFSSGGALRLAERYEYDVLASLSLDPFIRECTDNGIDLIERYVSGNSSGKYLQAAQKLSISLINALDVSEEAIAQQTRIDIAQLD